MLSKRRTAAIVGFLFLWALLIHAAYTANKGSIEIFENPNGKGFTAHFNKWSAKNKCQIPLEGGEVFQVEVARDSGRISLMVSGRNGSQPYAGNDLASGMFTVTVAATDEYVFLITGRQATGKIIVKNLGGND